MNAARLIEKSEKSPFYLWILNMSLSRMIPFNKPHRFKVLKIRSGMVEVKLPFTRSNMNHISGLHACALATLAEFTTGLTLLTSLDAKEYRIIMQKMEMNYLYQGKTDAIARYEVNDKWLNDNIINPAKDGAPVVVSCEVDILDIQQNKLAEGTIYWQIKSWTDVRTKR